jgi:bifunctional DNase/RNase
MVEVTVARIGVEANSQAYVVMLQEKDGERTLPIWIGKPEAEAIAAHVNGVPHDRPMTHDLAASLIAGLGALLRRVQVVRVVKGTFHGELHLTRAGTPIVVDARPSDAIAIAVRLDAPIFVAEQLFDDEDDAGLPSAPPADDDQLSPEELKRRLTQLRPEDFGRFIP